MENSNTSETFLIKNLEEGYKSVVLEQNEFEIRDASIFRTTLTVLNIEKSITGTGLIVF